MQREPTGIPIERLIPEHPAPKEPYKSVSRVSTFVVALLVVNVVLEIAATVFDLRMLGLLERVRDRSIDAVAGVEAQESRRQSLEDLQVLAVCSAGIAFIVWLRRAYRNLGALGFRRLRIPAGWAVGAWFVPVLGLFRPKSIVNDVWRASDASLPPKVSHPPDGAPVPSTINWWWAAFLVGGALVRVGRSGLFDSSLDELISVTRLLVVGDLLSSVAAILAILVVRAVTLRQEQRHLALTEVSGVAVRPA